MLLGLLTGPCDETLATGLYHGGHYQAAESGQLRGGKQPRGDPGWARRDKEKRIFGHTGRAIQYGSDKWVLIGLGWTRETQGSRLGEIAGHEERGGETEGERGIDGVRFDFIFQLEETIAETMGTHYLILGQADTKVINEAASFQRIPQFRQSGGIKFRLEAIVKKRISLRIAHLAVSRNPRHFLDSDGSPREAPTRDSTLRFTLGHPVPHTLTIRPPHGPTLSHPTPGSASRNIACLQTWNTTLRQPSYKPTPLKSCTLWLRNYPRASARLALPEPQCRYLWCLSPSDHGYLSLPRSRHAQDTQDKDPPAN
ncbi:hypothetical protein RRG08_038707 [Elysia crispata]|uniref:Uncharacterized protein n=1 Tax=Elysia crispata TaxID=231223 RepID=A0AAE0ZJR1_9GAST|nr:hypothetical protein RRG08_038707 [Elysia crispata]